VAFLAQSGFLGADILVNSCQEVLCCTLGPNSLQGVGFNTAACCVVVWPVAAAVAAAAALWPLLVELPSKG
jgi:hypothetical protein